MNVFETDARCGAVAQGVSGASRWASARRAWLSPTAVSGSDSGNVPTHLSLFAIRGRAGQLGPQAENREWEERDFFDFSNTG